MIKRISAFVYGAACYAVFFGTFLYAAGFVGNLIVPKSMDSPASGPWATALLIDVGLELLRDRIQEIRRVILDVEAHQVTGQEAFQELAPPGEGPVDLPVGPGDVPEHDDGEVGTPGPKRRRAESEVIVL